MSVSALVVTLEPSRAEAVIESIADDGRFTLGPRAGARQGMVLDTPDAVADRTAHDWLLALPGVLAVDVLAVYLDTPAETR